MSSFARSVCVITAALSLSLVGCSSDEGGEPEEGMTELGIDDGASAGVREMKLVKAAEGAELKLKTGAHLSIPEGALDKDTAITIERPADRKAVELVKTLERGYRVASAPYVLTPHGTKFKKDVELTLPINKMETNRLAVAYLEDEQDKTWEIIESAPGISGKFAGLALAHFSVLVLVEVSEDEPHAEPDAQSPDVLPGLDGGTMAAEAGDEPPPDAGGTGQDDAGNTPTGSIKERLIGRYDGCGFIVEAGEFSFDFEPSNQAQRCEAECMLNASCNDLANDACNLDMQHSPELQACLNNCYGSQPVICLDQAGAQVEAWTCDLNYECADGSDESGCPSSAIFMCDVEQSIRARNRCDGYVDCGNSADEQSCPPGTHFVCNDGQLIPKDWQCDVHMDCQDQSDEIGCSYFTCNDGSTISLRDVCDLDPDCGDSSDEIGHGCMEISCPGPLIGI